MGFSLSIKDHSDGAVILDLQGGIRNFTGQGTRALGHGSRDQETLDCGVETWPYY